MSPPPDPTPAADTLPPAAQTYQAIGQAAVVVMGAALFQTGADRWALVPVLVGAAGLVFRWRSAPPVVLATVAFATLGPHFYGTYFAFRWRAAPVLNLVLSLAVLSYAMAQYRLLSLTEALLPPDPLRPKAKAAVRPAESAEPREAVPALLAVVVAAVGAVFCWELTSTVPPPWPDVTWRDPARRDAAWRVGLLVWGLTALLLGLVSGLGYLGWRRQSRAEAALYLQDTLWAETRREQRRLQRWLAWARHRRERSAAG
jgi:hypothetical protein